MQELVMKITKAFQMNEDQAQELLGFPGGILNSVWNSYKKAPAHTEDPGSWFIKICGLRLRDRPDLVNTQSSFKKYGGKGENIGQRPLVKPIEPTREPRTAEQIAEFVQTRMLGQEMTALQERNPGLYNILSKMGKIIFERQLAWEMNSMSDNACKPSTIIPF